MAARSHQPLQAVQANSIAFSKQINRTRFHFVQQPAPFALILSLHGSLQGGIIPRDNSNDAWRAFISNFSRRRSEFVCWKFFPTGAH